MTEPQEGGFGADAIDDFSYDFDKWTGEVRGRVEIPEPSTDMVNDFFRDWTLAQTPMLNLQPEQAPEGVEESPEDTDARLARNLAAQVEASGQLRDRQIFLLSNVCRGPDTESGEGQTPSTETLAKLPHRVRRAFAGYVLGKLNPQL